MIPEPQNVEEVRREAGLADPQPTGERLRHAWRISIRYFVSEDWKMAWLLLILFIALQGSLVYISLLQNHWQQNFYDAVQQKDQNRFLAQVMVFIAIMAAMVGFDIVNSIVGWTFSVRWRNYLTDWYLGRWFARDRFYEIERLRMIDNPDQRIAEDIAAFTAMGGNTIGSSPLNTIISFVTSMVTAVSFGAIIWNVSQPIRLTAAGYAVAIPGDMVWYSIVYVLFASWFVAWIGKPYIRLQMRSQHYEADFRANLIHIRRNGEQIAFAGTHSLEHQGLRIGFQRIRRNWFHLMWANIGLNAGTGILQRLTSIAPLFIAIPRFFAGQISFGQAMAVRDAFIAFTGALSFFIDGYPMIAMQIANLNRIKALDDALDGDRPRGIVFSPGTDVGVAVSSKGLCLRRPTGETLVTIDDWTVREGDRWVVQGPSGMGKTTLLRAVAGLWPDGAGEVSLTRRGTAMLVPQRLYIPLGTLKSAVCFPDTSDKHDDPTVAALLERVNLGAHRDVMHEVRMWQEELSPGEQQRVALARILLHRPDLLVLDEATSALDPDNAQNFYRCILESMPAVTLISVVHNEKLARFHTHRLCLENGIGRADPIEED